MKKLVEALHVIQDECKKHYERQQVQCKNCPMWHEDERVCCVTDLEPHNWEINDKPHRVLL